MKAYTTEVMCPVCEKMIGSVEHDVLGEIDISHIRRQHERDSPTCALTDLWKRGCQANLFSNSYKPIRTDFPLAEPPFKGPY